MQLFFLIFTISLSITVFAHSTERLVQLRKQFKHYEQQPLTDANKHAMRQIITEIRSIGYPAEADRLEKNILKTGHTERQPVISKKAKLTSEQKYSPKSKTKMPPIAKEIARPHYQERTVPVEAAGIIQRAEEPVIMDLSPVKIKTKPASKSGSIRGKIRAAIDKIYKPKSKDQQAPRTITSLKKESNTVAPKTIQQKSSTLESSIPGMIASSYIPPEAESLWDTLDAAIKSTYDELIGVAIRTQKLDPAKQHDKQTLIDVMRIELLHDGYLKRG